MFVAAAVCPHPPLLVPEVAAGAAAEVEGLRSACDAVVRCVLDAGPELIVVVGAGNRTQTHAADRIGSLAPYGVPLIVPLGGQVAGGSPRLPLSVTIGAWLLQRSAWGGPRSGLEVGADESPARCDLLGASLAATAGRVGLLVMGDGSARRSEKAPGYLDQRAVEHDAAVARALGGGDTAVLRALDPVTSRDLLAAGRPAWQVLAGAAGDVRVRTRLLYDDAPYGVGYFVAARCAD